MIGWASEASVRERGGKGGGDGEGVCALSSIIAAALDRTGVSA